MSVHQNLCHCLFWLLTAYFCYVQCNRSPIPSKSHVFFTVKENATQGSAIFTLSAHDDDPGDDLTFNYVAGLGDDPDLLRLGQPRRNGTSTSNQWLCDVILNGVLDRDYRPSTRSMYYSVTDSKITIQFRVSIIVIDVNDNSPTFTGLPYRTSVNETEASDTVIFKVSARDVDLGKGGRVQYSMKASNDANEEDYKNTFKLDANTGEIKLLKSLDYKRQSFYHFKVSSFDEGDPQCPGPSCDCNSTIDSCEGESVDLFITIIDEQNSPPQFEKLPYFATINESQPVGSSVMQASAVDGDRGVSQPNSIFFSLSNDSYIPFQINRTNGVISVATELDADRPDSQEKGGFYVFSITATEIADGETTNANTTTQVTVTVTDVNDNMPEFEKDRYEATVIENTPSGVPLTVTTTIKVSDKDQGLNSQFQLSVENDNGETDLNFATIPGKNQKVQGSTTVTVIVVNSTLLDYESNQNLSIKLVAREVVSDTTMARFSKATLNIEIKDANDHSPIFLPNQTSFEVLENAAIDQLITEIKAEDEDSGDLGNITFSLEDTDNSNTPFKMAKNGSLYVSSKLDREERAIYSLMVVAMDNPNAPDDQKRRSLQRISLKILDVNDNSPVWPEVIPYLSVYESEKIGRNVGYLRATDKDIGSNGEIEYSIRNDSPGAQLFGVNKTSDGLCNLFVHNSLVGSSGNQKVTLIASDKGDQHREANHSVTIVIVSENLHKPVFANNFETNLTIDEELPVGTFVASFTATDEDKGENGNVIYRLLPLSNRDNDFFRIDVNGSLTVGKRLDKEDKGTYKFTIQAEDKGQPSLSTNLKVKVILTDIDDNPPSYRSITTPYEMSVMEENATAVIGHVLKAKDSDSSPQNTNNCYYIYGGAHLDSLFLEKTSGLLSLRKKLDREIETSFEIIVQTSSNCSEVINPTPSTNIASHQLDESMLLIQINVEDTNDHKPVFTQKDFSVGVLYDESIRSSVMSLASSVTDGDSPKYSQHLFRLLDLSPSAEMAQSLDTKTPAFSLSQNGNITTAIRFRPDMLGFFLMKVQVYDEDGLNDIAQVKIYIISNLQRVKLVFDKLPNEVERIKDNLLRQLSDILDLKIIADKIVSHTNGNGKNDPTKTDVYIHGRYKDTGEIVPAPKLWRALDYSPSASSLLSRNGVTRAEGLNKDNEDDEGNETERVFAIAVAVLAVILVAVCLVFLNMMRIYRRRLKAATTKAFASPKEQEIYGHPGTNKYHAAKNPIFGKEIKNTDLEEDEKLSTNSLDINAVDQFTKQNAEQEEEEQEVVLQISDSALSTPQHNGNAHLDKVLHEYEKLKKHGNEDISHSYVPPKPLSGRRTGPAIPGLGTEIQEGVTRFADENLSGDSGFPEGDNGLSFNKGDLEYSDI